MAPISTKVIALLTAMLEHLQDNPDDSEEMESLIKATLQAISGRKRSSVRRIWDALGDFYDESPGKAVTCAMIALAIVSQSGTAITRLGEQYGIFEPRKMQIEVKDPETGAVTPASKNDIEHLTGIANYAHGYGISNKGFGQAFEVTTENGTRVSWSGGDPAGAVVFGGGGESGNGSGSVRGGVAGAAIRSGGTGDMSERWESRKSAL